jgi:hypothetical protein
MPNIEPGTVIQLDPEHCQWGCLLCIVDSVRAWGVVCYALMPEQRGTSPSCMFMRVKHGQYMALGTAEWTMGAASEAPDLESGEPHG